MPRLLVPAFALFLAALAPLSSANADEAAQKDLVASDLLPATTALYAEASDPGRLVDLVLDHPIAKRVQEVEAYKKTFETPEYQQFLLGVKMLEGVVEMPWRPAVKLIAQGGVYAAVDAETGGTAILVKSGSPAKLTALRQAIFTLARGEAKRKGKEDPIKTGEYRGLTAYTAGAARLALFGDWLIVTNKDELGKGVLDRFLDAGQDASGTSSLSQNSQYQEAHRTRPDAALGWGYADVKTLREKGATKKLEKGPQDNPLAELILGGILEAAKEAPFATATLEADSRHVAITSSMPFDAAWIGESRAYYFGADGEGAAPPLAKAKETVLSLSTHRDLTDFWASAPELFDENIKSKFAEVNSSLSTLFSGRDFGDEVLGSVKPEMQIVVARQQFPQTDLPAPNIKLPAFAAVLRMKDPARMRRPMKVSLQSLIGFLNVVGAMNGQPVFELSTDQRGKTEIISAKYLPPVDEEDAKKGLINYNFSPAAVFVEDVFIVSSTKALAEELAESAVGEAAAEKTQTNTQARLDSGVFAAILNDNREQLIAQNILEKGHSREEAEKEIGAVFEILDWVRGSSLQLTREEGLLRLKLDVELAGQ